MEEGGEEGHMCIVSTAYPTVHLFAGVPLIDFVGAPQLFNSCTDLQLWDDSTSLPAMLQNRFLKTCRQAMIWRKAHQGYYQVGLLPKVQGRGWPHTKVVRARGSEVQQQCTFTYHKFLKICSL